jgi:hypothetical protein
VVSLHANYLLLQGRKFVSFVSYLATVSECYSEYIDWDGRISDKLEIIWNDAVVGCIRYISSFM